MHTVECTIDIEVFQDSFIDGVAWVAVSTQSRTKKAEAEKFLGLTPPSRKPKAHNRMLLQVWHVADVDVVCQVAPLLWLSWRVQFKLSLNIQQLRTMECVVVSATAAVPNFIAD